MNRDERNAARERLDLFLHAEGGGSPVSRAELAGYLDAALKQMDDDEGLMRQAIGAIGVGRLYQTEVWDDAKRICADHGRYRTDWEQINSALDALRARLDPPAPEPEADHDE